MRPVGPRLCPGPDRRTLGIGMDARSMVGLVLPIADAVLDVWDWPATRPGDDRDGGALVIGQGRSRALSPNSCQR